MFSVGLSLFKRDFTLALRQGGYFGSSIGFFLSMLALVPLSLGPDPTLLERCAAGFLWIALLLSTLLSTDSLFLSDFEDGSLEAIALSPCSLSLFVFMKTVIHWLLSGVPLAVLAPILGVLLHLDFSLLFPLMLSMGIGSLGLCFVATLSSAVTLGLKRAGLLMALLTLPLYIPFLIFGLSASSPNLFHESVALSSFCLLCALTLTLMMCLPFATAVVLKTHLS